MIARIRPHDVSRFVPPPPLVARAPSDVVPSGGIEQTDRYLGPSRDDRTPPAAVAGAYQVSVGDDGTRVTANGLPVLTGVEAGKPLQFSYLKSYGVPTDAVESVTLHYRIDGQPFPSLPLATRTTRGQAALVRQTATIDVPASARGELEYWVETRTRDGEVRFDSNVGQNHRLNVMPAGGTTVRFDDLFTHPVEGKVIAGATLRLNYDADRIRKFLGDQELRGLPTLGIEAFVSFDGAVPVRLPVAQFDSNRTLQTLEAAIEVPADATSVEVWFQGKGAYNDLYDSSSGANYRFEVERR